MQRCLELAKKGQGFVAPNPMVGAVLVHRDTIIGEGYHKKHGEAHAEVNCIEDVSPDLKHLIPESTLYVSLEPCSHHGKTPPCTDLIIRSGIKTVIVACNDPFEKVNGSGFQNLRAAGINVQVGSMEMESMYLNRRFFTFHKMQRPYIILKWAQSLEGKIADDSISRTFITNRYTNILVHKWRAEESAILIGNNTAILDDPELTNRHWYGNNPLRVVIDRHLKMPDNNRLLSDGVPVIVINTIKHEQAGNKIFYRTSSIETVLADTLNMLHQRNILSVIVEGGAAILQAFINAALWDEARVITSSAVQILRGPNAPVLRDALIKDSDTIAGDNIHYFVHEPSS